jgi:uncharacterized protein (TIGR01619 family)
MNEDWCFFYRLVDERPTAIFVNLGLYGEAPVAGMEHVVWLRLRLRQPDEDGLSAREEASRLHQIEDALVESLAPLSDAAAYVGSNTCDGIRDYLFYAQDAAGVEQCLTGAMRQFGEYEFATGTRPDDEWSLYHDYLLPSDRELQMVLNQRLLSTLKEQGDQHAIPREVEHRLYFPAPDDRSGFAQAAQQAGYRVVQEMDDGEAERPYGVSIARSDAIDFLTINDVVMGLYDLAEEFDGEYDGWQTTVVTEG